MLVKVTARLGGSPTLPLSSVGGNQGNNLGAGRTACPNNNWNAICDLAVMVALPLSSRASAPTAALPLLWHHHSCRLLRTRVILWLQAEQSAQIKIGMPSVIQLWLSSRASAPIATSLLLWLSHCSRLLRQPHCKCGCVSPRVFVESQQPGSVDCAYLVYHSLRAK